MLKFLYWFFIGSTHSLCIHKFDKWKIIDLHNQGCYGSKVLHQTRICSKCGYTEMKMKAA